MAEEEKFVHEKEVLNEFIRGRGLRRTNQRDTILEIFLQTEDHLSSEDLYWLVNQIDQSIGQTTVYRSLKLFAEAGLAREVRFGDNITYYEHHLDHDHHDHIICTQCGTVVEFFSEELEKMQDAAAEKYGFVPTHHSLRIWGLCATCKTLPAVDSIAPSGVQPRTRPKANVG